MRAIQREMALSAGPAFKERGKGENVLPSKNADLFGS